MEKAAHRQSTLLVALVYLVYCFARSAGTTLRIPSFIVTSGADNRAGGNGGETHMQQQLVPMKRAACGARKQ